MNLLTIDDAYVILSGMTQETSATTITDTAANNREVLYGIRRQLLAGEITYDAAKVQAKPLIDAINAKNAVIGKKYGRKAGKVTFAAIMR